MKAISRDIDEKLVFALSVGAYIPDEVNSLHTLFLKLPWRKNYFALDDVLIIVKISRTDPPWWGIDKSAIQILSELKEYFLILLVNSRQGYVISKHDVSRHINGRWKYRSKDNNYKINHNQLRNEYWFASPEDLLKKCGITGDRSDEQLEYTLAHYGFSKEIIAEALKPTD